MRLADLRAQSAGQQLAPDVNAALQAYARMNPVAANVIDREFAELMARAQEAPPHQAALLTAELQLFFHRVAGLPPELRHGRAKRRYYQKLQKKMEKRHASKRS